MPTTLLRVLQLLLWCGVASIEAGKFWVITDWHINNWFQASPPLQNASEASVLSLCHTATNQTILRPGKWGSFGCSSSLELWQSTLSHMKATEAAPDFVLWLGDNYGHVANDSEELVLASTELLGRLIRQNFPGVPVIAAVGNHDTWPYNADPGPAFYQKLVTAWGAGLNSTQASTANQAGYYATTLGTLRILSLNTQHLSGEVLSWLEVQLKQASAAAEKVLIGAHIPAGPAACYNCSCSNGYQGDCWSTAWEANFIQLILRHSDVVVGIISGHTHSDEFRILADDKSSAAVPMYILPSLPPYNPDTNPAVRLFLTDDSTHQLVDYRQWTMDLAASNLIGQPQWSQYSPLALYQLPAPLSAQTLRHLHDQLWVDDDLFQVYYQAYGSFPAIPTACTNEWSSSVYSPQGGGGRCKSMLLCPIMMGSDNDQVYYQCLQSHNSTQNDHRG